MGDVVLIQDSNVARGEWKMRIITTVHPSNDNKVRRVTVSYKNYRKDEDPGRCLGAKYTNTQQKVVFLFQEKKTCFKNVFLETRNFELGRIARKNF